MGITEGGREIDEEESLMFARINAQSVKFARAHTHTHSERKRTLFPLSPLMTAPPTQRLDLEHAKSPASLVLLSSAAPHATAAAAGGWGAGRNQRDKEPKQVRQMPQRCFPCQSGRDFRREQKVACVRFRERNCGVKSK